MKTLRTLPATLAVLALACGGGETAGDTARDLEMAPAESIAPMADTPATRTAEPQAARPPARQTPQTQTPQRQAPAQPPAPTTVTLTAPEGTTLWLVASDTLTSRHNKKGDTVQAVVTEAVVDARGRVVIPPQSIVFGTISDIAPAESPGGEGRMVITYNRVLMGGQMFEMQARTDSLAAHMKGRGVTVGDAAKVGAGAVVGGIAGRIIGGNKTGTIVGAAAGAAAGAGIAAATRDIDIILPQGAPVRLVLTAPFSVQVATN